MCRLRGNPRFVLRGFKGIIPTTEPEKIRGLIGKKKVWKCRVIGYDIYIVDGKHVRAQWADFLGGHHLVYRFIPKAEIWIDGSIHEWFGYIASHELLEVLLMQLRGWKYEQAHEAANALEQELRGAAERKQISGPLIAEIWGYHLAALFPKGESTQTIADTIARMLWRFL